MRARDLNSLIAMDVTRDPVLLPIEITTVACRDLVETIRAPSGPVKASWGKRPNSGRRGVDHRMRGGVGDGGPASVFVVALS